MWNSSDGWVRLAQKVWKGKQEFTVSLFFLLNPEQINLKASKWESCHDLPHPSVVSPVSEVVKILYHCCSIYPPNLPLSFYLCFAAATTIYNLLFTLITRREVCSLIILVHDLSHVSMHVQCVHLPSSSCGIWRQRHAGIYRNSVTTTSPISHVFHLQDFYLFSFTFCFVLSLLGRSSRPMRCKLS